MTDYREFQDGEVVPGTRYRVTRLIGSGGMGRVYEVEHQELGKRFVLKALLRELSRREDLVARLRNEWRALARLEHPNIVTVTDAGTSENGVPFYVMERLEGETLAALLHRERRLHPQRALGIAASILQGLHAAHRIGVVHRDVKPPNIFLTASGAVKVLDFGIAKIKDAKGVITARGIAVGTPRYMSPEQAQGSPVDARSDIYATALMLFEMVSGLGPFDDAKDNNELLLAHLGRPAPLLSSICVVAPELDALVAGMLAKDPRERPGNAQQVAETLLSLGHRYAHFVATDAPTVNVTPRPHGSIELPTRQDIRRAPAPGAPTRPDAPAAFSRSASPPVPPTTTLRPALESATTIAELLPAAVAGGTVRITPAPSPSPPSLYGPDTLMDSLTGAPTGIPAPITVHTETLVTPPVYPGQRAPTEAGPTRTAVPLVEPNLTPPPVVPAPASVRSVRATESRRWLVVAAAGVGVGGLAVAALWWRAVPPSPLRGAAAAAAAAAAAGEERAVPALAEVAPPVPSLAEVAPPVPSPGVPAATASAAPSTELTARADPRPVAPPPAPSAARPPVASGGLASKKSAFLGAVLSPAERPASSARPAQSSARAPVSMPGSGL